jgi:hypothetical protein
MSEDRAPGSSTLPLPDLNTAVRWLRQHEVKSNRLARLLHTTPEYVRLLNYRGKFPLSFNSPSSLDALLSPPGEALRRRLGVRPEEDSVVYSERQSGRIAALDAEIEEVWVSHAQSGRFLEGLRSLQSFEAERGYPSSAKWFRLMARLHQYCAWFRVHSGLSTSALQEAKIAIDLSHLAYHESEDPIDLRRLGEACLIGSNACLLSSNPNAAMKMLDVAAAASARISDLLGSEHYRQRGTALLQMFQDEEAAKQFASAKPAMERKKEAQKESQLSMADNRQRALLGEPNMAMAVDVLEQVRRDFSWTGLEHVMCLNWAAACALATDSPTLHSQAQAYLRESLVLSARYGHQATRAHLLALTPELGLNLRYWREWVRRALYENAFKGS